MQFLESLQLLGWISIVIGALILCLAFAKTSNQSEIGVNRTKTESKGIILIGPIPIVWGYGKKSWLLAGIIGIALFIAIWLFFG